MWNFWSLIKIKSVNSAEVSFQFSCPVMSNSLQAHGLQHTRLLCPSPTPGACIHWIGYVIHPSHPLYFPSPHAFNLSQYQGLFISIRLFSSGSQTIGVSASTSELPMNIQDWFPIGWTGWISLLSKGLSKVFSGTIVWKHQFFGIQFSL